MIFSIYKNVFSHYKQNKILLPTPEIFFPTTFDLLFLPKGQFLNKKIWCFETKPWSKVNFSKCVQGCAETTVWFVMSQTVTVLAGEIWISFSSYKISLFKVAPFSWGWLWITQTLVVFIWQKRMCNQAVIFATGKERL